MQVLCSKHKLTFAVTSFNKKTGRNEYSAKKDDTVTVSPKPEIQTLPDWVRDTNTFQEALKAGRIFEINVLGTVPIAALATA
jgi:hypothetical protein